MAGTLTRGYTFGATEEVTAAKLHALVDSGTVSGITADEIASGTITNDKISDVSGAKFTNLANIPEGAGIIPAANIPIDTSTDLDGALASDSKVPSQKAVRTYAAAKGANSDITSLSGLTTPLSVGQGGTGVITGLPSLGSWVSKTVGTSYLAETDGFIVGAIRARQPSGGESYVYTDSSNPPTTARVTAVMWDGVALVPFCVAVRKNDYYKVTSGSESGYVPYAYWIPLGS